MPSAMLIFSAATAAFTYGILRLQGHLPWHQNVDALANKTPMTPDLAFNTAASFATNTNWQSYGGENTMSYFSQMVALGIAQLFLGRRWASPSRRRWCAVCARPSPKRSAISGSIWCGPHLYLLLPICIVYAVFLVSQGMIQNFRPYTNVTAVDQSGAAAGQPLTQIHRAGADGVAGRHQDARAPTAAALSTPTPRIRLRIPRR